MSENAWLSGRYAAGMVVWPHTVVDVLVQACAHPVARGVSSMSYESGVLA